MSRAGMLEQQEESILQHFAAEAVSAPIATVRIPELPAFSSQNDFVLFRKGRRFCRPMPGFKSFLKRALTGVSCEPIPATQLSAFIMAIGGSREADILRRRHHQLGSGAGKVIVALEQIHYLLLDQLKGNKGFLPVDSAVTVFDIVNPEISEHHLDDGTQTIAVRFNRCVWEIGVDWSPLWISGRENFQKPHQVVRAY
jgi:hypothetical protein